jgi:hypothetical protein
MNEKRCRYGLNPEFLTQLTSGPVRIAAEDRSHEVPAAELDGHPFFVATLFSPSGRRSKGKPRRSSRRSFTLALLGPVHKVSDVIARPCLLDLRRVVRRHVRLQILSATGSEASNSALHHYRSGRVTVALYPTVRTTLPTEWPCSTEFRA